MLGVHFASMTRNAIPAFCTLVRSMSPIDATVVSWPDRSGLSSKARQRPDSASIFDVSEYPGSPPETSVTTRLPPPSPTKLILNQLLARRASLGPSPGDFAFSSSLRAGGIGARTATVPMPAAIPPIVARCLATRLWP